MATPRKELSLDPKRYVPTMDCVDQDQMTALLAHLDKTIKYDAVRNPCCGHCWEPRIEGHALPLECALPCGACGLSDHTGFYCPRLYLSIRCWRRVYNVQWPPEYVQVKPVGDDWDILRELGFLDADNNWTMDLPLSRTPTTNPPVVYQPRSEQGASAPRGGPNRGGRAPPSRASHTQAQRYSPYARPSHPASAYTSSPRISSPQTPSSTMSSSYRHRASQPPQQSGYSPQARPGYAPQIGRPPLPPAASSSIVPSNAPQSVAPPGSGRTPAEERERTAQLVDNTTIETFKTIQAAITNGLSWEQIGAMLDDGLMSEKFKSANPFLPANAQQIESGQPQLTESNLKQHASCETVYAPTEQGDVNMGGALPPDHAHQSS